MGRWTDTEKMNIFQKELCEDCLDAPMDDCPCGCMRKAIYNALLKLKDYEDTGLEPEEISQLKTDVLDIKKSVDVLWKKQDFLKFLETKGIEINTGVNWMCDVFDILHDDRNNELISIARLRELVKAENRRRKRGRRRSD